MSDPVNQQVVQPAADEAEDVRFRRRIVAVMVVFGLLIAAMSIYIALSGVERDDERRLFNTQLGALGQQVRSLGGRPVVTPEGAESPPPPTVPPVAAPPPPRPRQPAPVGLAEVRRVVRATVTGLPTVADVARIATDVYAANPPEDGQDGEKGDPVPPAQIAATVAAFCAGDACRGPTGEPGPPPSDDQIARVVNAVIDGNPERFRGPPGRDGQGCPTGYEYRPFVAMTADGGGYRDALACVDPDSTVAPPPPSPPPSQTSVPPTE